MHRLQFSATALVSLPAVLGVGILTPVFISPAISQSIQIAQRPEFTIPDSGDNSTSPPTSEAPQTTPSPMPSSIPTSVPTSNPKPAQTATQNLTGRWLYKTDESSSELEIIQSGSSLKVIEEVSAFESLESGGVMVEGRREGTATVSGNQIRISLPKFYSAFQLEMQGTISEDGNTIVGQNNIIGYETPLDVPFTMQKVGETASPQQSAQPRP